MSIIYYIYFFGGQIGIEGFWEIDTGIFQDERLKKKRVEFLNAGQKAEGWFRNLVLESAHGVAGGAATGAYFRHHQALVKTSSVTIRNKSTKFEFIKYLQSNKISYILYCQKFYRFQIFCIMEWKLMTLA